MDTIETILTTRATRRFTAEPAADDGRSAGRSRRAPGRFEIAALVPVGHPSGKFGVAPRKPAAAVTHWNRWGDKRR